MHDCKREVYDLTTISELREKYGIYNQRLKDCNHKFDRLEPVYSELGRIKRSFRTAQKSTGKIFDEKGIWRGEKYTSFCTAGDMLDDSLETYYKRLDSAQDAVNEAISGLKQEKLRLIPIVGGLLAQIEQFSTDVENVLN